MCVLCATVIVKRSINQNALLLLLICISNMLFGSQCNVGATLMSRVPSFTFDDMFQIPQQKTIIVGISARFNEIQMDVDDATAGRNF